MSYFNLYVKKPVSDSSLVEEVSLMIDVVKPSRKTFIMGLARHIVIQNDESIDLDRLVELLILSTTDDEFLHVDEEELIKWIKDDKYIIVANGTTDVSDHKNLISLADGVTEENISYVTTLDLWSNYTNLTNTNLRPGN